MDHGRRVFVTSDWHLGGEPDRFDADGKLVSTGSQICRSVQQLVTFIDWVAVQSATDGCIVELVINGDMVDFLAPDREARPRIWIPSEDEVILRLDRIIERTSQMCANERGPFEALADFVQRERCELTLLLGNHDVELSLPRVRRHLEGKLGATRGRFRFVYDGEAYVQGPVLFEHGNRYDAWNIIDHSGLRQERSHLSRGIPVDETSRHSRFFRPPAGTYLVAYAINVLLRECPFINLLKPETGTVVPLLLWLQPEFAGVINNLLALSPVLKRKREGRLAGPAVPARSGNLTGAHVQASAESLNSLAPLLKEMVGDEQAAEILKASFNELSAGAVVLDRWRWLENKVKALSEMAGSAGRLLALLKPDVPAAHLSKLRRALRSVQDSSAFETGIEAADYLESATELMRHGGFEVVAFGHTHLPKEISVPLGNGKKGLYLNTGTWANIMRLPPAIFEESDETKETFGRFAAALAGNRIEQYLCSYLTYAEINLQGGKVTSARLHSFTMNEQRERPLTAYQA